MRMRRAVLMTRQAISPRLAIRIVLNIAPLREKPPAFPQGSFLLERRKRVNNPRRRAVCRRRAPRRPASGADFDLSPRVLKSRAGQVAAISRPESRRIKRRSGPRKAAEAKVSGSDGPIDP